MFCFIIFFRGDSMKEKVIGILIVGLLLVTVFPCVKASTQKTDVTKNTTNDVYPSGWIILLSSNIQGIEKGLHFGGMSDINITATYQNTLLIRTKPIWGSAIITEDVDLQIQIKHFFGIVDIYGTSGEIIGICEDVSWKII